MEIFAYALSFIIILIVGYNIWLRSLDWSEVQFYKNSEFKDKKDFIRYHLIKSIFSRGTYVVNSKKGKVASVEWISAGGWRLLTINNDMINQIKTISMAVEKMSKE